MKLRLQVFIFTFFVSISAIAAQQTPKNFELLDKNYVQIEVSNVNAVTVSVLQTLKNLTQLIQMKYYSLLSWQSHTRRTNLEIENYDRKSQFGSWINDPNDGLCFNTRTKVLVRDSVKAVTFKDSNRCMVEQGAWADPYTALTLSSPSGVQIDHLVPLKNAYMSGAYKWNFKQRCLYANYLGEDFHLLPVDSTQNMKKGDRSPDRFIPPNSKYTCTYLRNWLAVKMLWGLTMKPEEALFIRQMIDERNCRLADFRMTDSELNFQRQFAKDNIDLCEKINKGHN